MSKELWSRLRIALLAPALLFLLLVLPDFRPERGPALESGPASCSPSTCIHTGSEETPGTFQRGEIPDDDDDAAERAETTSKKLSSELLVGAEPVAGDESPAFLELLVASPIRAPPL